MWISIEITKYGIMCLPCQIHQILSSMSQSVHDQDQLIQQSSQIASHPFLRSCCNDPKNQLLNSLTEFSLLKLSPGMIRDVGWADQNRIVSKLFRLITAVRLLLFLQRQCFLSGNYTHCVKIFRIGDISQTQHKEVFASHFLPLLCVKLLTKQELISRIMHLYRL